MTDAIGLGLTLLLLLPPTLPLVTSVLGPGLWLAGLPLGLLLRLALAVSETEPGLAWGLPVAGLPAAVPWRMPHTPHSKRQANTVHVECGVLLARGSWSCLHEQRRQSALHTENLAKRQWTSHLALIHRCDRLPCFWTRGGGHASNSPTLSPRATTFQNNGRMKQGPMLPACDDKLLT